MQWNAVHYLTENLSVTKFRFLRCFHAGLHVDPTVEDSRNKAVLHELTIVLLVRCPDYFLSIFS
jgi:hypothetical protein